MNKSAAFELTAIEHLILEKMIECSVTYLDFVEHGVTEQAMHEHMGRINRVLDEQIPDFDGVQVEPLFVH